MFISIESSPDVVEEALKVGAGYVHKIHASTELLPAIDIVLNGKQFVTPSAAMQRAREALGRLDESVEKPPPDDSPVKKE